MTDAAGSPVVVAIAVPALAFATLALAAVVGMCVALWKLRGRRETIVGLRDDLARAAHAAAAEQAHAHETRERLEHALDVIPQAVLITDAAGGVVFRNQVAEHFESARHATRWSRPPSASWSPPRSPARSGSARSTCSAHPAARWSSPPAR